MRCYTSVHVSIWYVYKNQCRRAYDVRLQPSCWSAARPMDVWSSGCKRRDESVSFLHFLSLSHSGNQMDLLLSISFSVLTHNFLAPFFLPILLHPFHPFFQSFSALWVLLGGQKGCITKYSPTNPGFHYEPLTHADNGILQPTDRLWIR